MTLTTKILTYELREVSRSRWLLAYAGFFLLVTLGLLRFGGGTTSALLSLVNVVLVVVPLVSLVFGTVYRYQAQSFSELLLAHPVPRAALFTGLYVGLALSLAVGFAAGLLLPFLLYGVDAAAHYRTLILLVLVGSTLTFIFVGIAAGLATRLADTMKGLGAALLLWLFFTVLYDGLLLVGLSLFAAYPLETPVLLLSLLNPVDLARILLLLTFDVAAMMGYTGAVFERFFGGWLGWLVVSGALLAWVGLPYCWAKRAFLQQDF